MRRKLTAVVAAILLALLSTGLAAAQTTAYATSFTTSITYQNVGNGLADISVIYYAENSPTPISTTLAQLPAGAGSSVFVGNVTQVGAGFKGSAILSSNQPLVATLVQIPAAASSVKNRPLSNGFSAGASKVLLATVLKNKFNTTTVFSVQNAGSTAANVTVKLFNADAPANAPIQLTANSLPAGATKYFDLGQTASVPNNFNGSATIDAGAGTVVASAMELSTTGTAASAFEGVTGGSNTVYMPSALCQAFGGTNTAYAIQNVETSGTASVTVTYSNGHTDAFSIAAGTKKSALGCGATGTLNPAGFSGSATITSTGGKIVAIGKVSGLGISSAFLGAAAGTPKLALPYVRWSQTQFSTGARQRAFIAIQNVGGPLAAGAVTVKYFDKNGVLVGTHTLGAIATGAKLNSTPHDIGAAGDEFGYGAGGFGGGAIIQGPAGSQLVAVVRIASFVPATSSTVGEDYNGLDIQ